MRVAIPSSRLRFVVLAAALLCAAVGAALAFAASGQAAKRHRHRHKPAPTRRIPSYSDRVLRVGTWKGVAGQYSSVQAAIDAAKPGDWILVGPGDYHEQADHRANRGPQPADTPAGVVISTPNLHLRGMDRNGVVIDGTKPGAPQCSNKQADQDFGVNGADGKPLGRNGILIWKANDNWVENLTVCNYLNGAGNVGNEVWWNGGDGGGKVGEFNYWGNYINATSTFFKDESTAMAYGIFSSDASNGWWNHDYASNTSDSNYYVGGCQNICNMVMNHDWSQYGSLGYSGTNAGGKLVIENSEFDHNKDGFDTNSQNNSDRPSPQDGTCPNNAISPITHTHSCWIFMNNYVHDNNNPNVPGAGVASNGPTGTGISISGGRNDTVMNNRFVNNGAWGVVLVPYPDTETPPAGQNCQGGISGPGNFCLFDDWSDAIVGNTFTHNGFFGNDTNGDFAELTSTAAPTNCFHANRDTAGAVTSSPSGLEQSKPSCDGHTVPPDPNPSFLNQIGCDTQFFASLSPTGSSPCTPGSSYPQSTGVQMPPLPPASQLPSMPNPCAGVPSNPWCPAGSSQTSHSRKHHKRKHAKKKQRRHDYV